MHKASAPRDDRMNIDRLRTEWEDRYLEVGSRHKATVVEKYPNREEREG
jgi:hypothetical protein